MNKKYKFILMLLIVVFAISSYFFIKEIAENKKENDIYEDLQEIVQNEENTTNENDHTDILNNKTSNLSNENQADTSNTYNLENISKINADVIGWIKINGTNINYPIMQNGDYYLHRNIYKNYSSHGTPYLAEYCNVQYSDNLIIYGHHMNDNSMFAQLDDYKKHSFYKSHRFIKFYSYYKGQTIEKNYEIALVFKTVAYSDKGFKYYSYTNFSDIQELNEFLSNCKNLQCYDTGVDINYGDKLITLSTCEYSQKNGRMVIVAKQI